MRRAVGLFAERGLEGAHTDSGDELILEDELLELPEQEDEDEQHRQVLNPRPLQVQPEARPARDTAFKRIAHVDAE